MTVRIVDAMCVLCLILLLSLLLVVVVMGVFLVGLVFVQMLHARFVLARGCVGARVC